MLNGKKWGIALLVLALLSLCAVGAVTAYIDPFFYYHAPLDFLQYPFTDQRYLNDGIERHFEYDALITGTSMTENFRASQLDELFGVSSVKVCFNGSTYQELSDNLRRALEYNPDIRLVLFGLDSWFLQETPGAMRTDVAYPTYLYDNRLFNDVSYVLNKDVLFRHSIHVLGYTLQGGVTTSFDEYSFWCTAPETMLGKEIVMGKTSRKPASVAQEPLSQQNRERIVSYFTDNAVALARAYPDTEFLYFFPPVSILYWDDLDRMGMRELQLESLELVSRLLLAEDNIRLFSFFDDFETITNLDHYADMAHYGDHINGLLLERMARGEGELNLDNYREHWRKISDFYGSYDYDSIYEEA